MHKRHLILLTFLLLVGGWRAQGQNITAAGSSCTTAGACAVIQLSTTNTGSVTFTISGTFSATLQFEVLADGTEANKSSVNCVPPNSTTAVTSTTAAGTWTCNVPGAQVFRVRCSAYTSGTAVVALNASNAIDTALLGSGGGGGGSGTVTSVTFTGDGAVLSATPSSAVTTSGTLTATLANQTANTVLGALTATTPSDLALPSCSATTSALIWTSGTGFGCHTITPGTGTVTSVTFTGDGIIDSSTPSTAVTTSGTVAATPLTQTANTVLAGPASGSAANPAFRALVSLDVPDNAANTSGTAANVTGIVAAANGGTGVANTATQTLGTSNINYATQATGFDYVTTTTGAHAAATAAQAATLIQGLTGCNTANFVFTPQASDCVAQSGSGLSGMTAGQVAIAATASTVTSSKAIVGTDTGLASAATISTTAGTITCSTANGGVTTTGCPASLPAVTNTTAVTVSNPTAATDTILMALSLPAGYLNVVGQPFIVHGSGVLTTTTASVPQVTITPKLCSVAGCATGTVTPLAAIQSAALNSVAISNATWAIDLTMTVVANGSSCNLIVKGSPGLIIEAGASVATADSVYADANTAVSSPNQNCANALFLDFFVQQSTTGASNSYKQLEAVIAPPSGVGGSSGSGITSATMGGSSSAIVWSTSQQIRNIYGGPQATNTTVAIDEVPQGRAKTIIGIQWALSAAQASATTNLTFTFVDATASTSAVCQVTTNVTTTTTCSSVVSLSVAQGDLCYVEFALGGGTGTSAALGWEITYQ